MKAFGFCLGLGGVLFAGTAGAQPSSKPGASSPPVYQPPVPALRGTDFIIPEPPRALKSLPEDGQGGGTPIQPIFNYPGTTEKQQLDAINNMVNRAIKLGDVAPNYQRIADTLDKGFPDLFTPDSLGYEARRKIAEQNIRLAGIDPKDIRDLPPIQQPPAGNGQNGNEGFKQTIDEINKLFKTQAEMIRSIDVGSVRRLDPNLNGGIGEATDGGIVVIGGRTGLQLGLIPPNVYDHLKIPRDQGLLVKEVFPKTPAEAAGYKKNDILIELNGVKVPSNIPDFFEKVMRTVKNDKPFTGVVLRAGEPVDVNAMKINDRRVVPALPNERAPDLSSIIQVVPGINSDQVKTNRVPEVRMIRTVTRDGIVTTEFIPVDPNKK